MAILNPDTSSSPNPLYRFAGIVANVNKDGGLSEFYYLEDSGLISDIDIVKRFFQYRTRGSRVRLIPLNKGGSEADTKPVTLAANKA